MKNSRRFALLLAVWGPLLGGSLAARAEEGDDSPIVDPRVKVETSKGAFVLELNVDRAPETVLNFLQYAKEGYYKDTIFHRVVNDNLIQGGRYLKSLDEKSGLRDPIVGEDRNGLSNQRGTIAMYREASPDSAQAEFFINLADNSQRLDHPAVEGRGYTVFGKVVEGMEVVDAIGDVEVSTHPKLAAGYLPQVPKEPVVINAVSLINEDAFDRSRLEKRVAEARQQRAADEAESQKTDEQRRDELVARIESETGKEFVKRDCDVLTLDVEEGQGPQPATGDRVDIHYVGRLLDGTQFESTLEETEPRRIELNKLIYGLRVALESMNVGGKRIIIVPPDCGFGVQGIPGRIPPESTLVYEIELLNIH